MAKVLIGYSACPLTRKAFEAQGHSVTTCDLLPSRDGAGVHYQGDVWDILWHPWDFAVLHPMCTYLTVSAAWAYADPDFERYPYVGYHQRVKSGTLTGAKRRRERENALNNFQSLLDLPYPVAIENPAPSFINTAIRQPNQIIQPWMFGDDASKSTGVWLTKGAPLLEPLESSLRAQPRLVQGKGGVLMRWANQTDSGQNRLSPSETRWLERSATYPGIAHAMGTQWGRWLNERG